MNLSANFEEAIESMKRPAAIVALVTSAFSLAGCAGGRLAIPDHTIGSIPVGRVLNQSVNRDIFDAKKGVYSGVRGATKLQHCRDGSIVMGDPRQCDVQQNSDGVQPRQPNP